MNDTKITFITPDVTPQELCQIRNKDQLKSYIVLYGKQDECCLESLGAKFDPNYLETIDLSKMQVDTDKPYATWTDEEFHTYIQKARTQITDTFIDCATQDNAYIMGLFSVVHEALAKFGTPIAFDRQPINVPKMMPELIQFLVPRAGDYEQCMEWLKERTKGLESPPVISDEQLLSWPGVRVEHYIVENRAVDNEIINLGTKALKELQRHL